MNAKMDCKVSSSLNLKTIIDFLLISNASEKYSKLDDFVRRLADEMKKIKAFERELPLTMQLLDNVYVAMKEEMIRCKKEINEPVLEEFLPLNKTSKDEEDEKLKSKKEKDIDNSKDKSNWMKSVQLWNSDNQPKHQNPNLNSSNKKPLDLSIQKRKEEENVKLVMDNGLQSGKNRAFVPFKGASFQVNGLRREEGLSLCIPQMKNLEKDIGFGGLSSNLSSSTVTNGQSGFRIVQPQNQQQQQAARKQRRCWSPELHRRFVNALEQLGGPQVATPKQIRELMQTDGLTNDEVKSHLQKFRLHTRKATSQNQPVVALGGLWMSEARSGESSKQCNSQSGSPEGPLHLSGSRATSATDDNSMDDEDDVKSESHHSWKKPMSSVFRQK